MANLLKTTQNDVEPLALEYHELRDSYAVASGVFVKGEIVSITAPNAIVKFVPASNAPMAIMVNDVDASGGAVSGVSAYVKGKFDERKVNFNGGDADTTTAVWGPTLTTRDALRLMNIDLVSAYSIDRQQV